LAGKSVNYNLGVTLSAESLNIDKELKKVENRFKKLSDTIDKSVKDVNKTLSISSEAIEDYAKEYNQLNAKLNQLETSQNKASKKIKESTQITKQSSKAMNKANKNIDNNTKQKSKNKKETDNWLSSQSRSLAIATKSTVVWGAATTAIYGTQRALKQMHKTMMEIDSEMIALRRVMTEATTDFNELRNVAGDLGVEFASNIQNVISSMVEWGRQGRNQVEVIELTEAALLATNVAEMEAKEAVDMLTASLLQFNMDASEAVSIIDRWNEVANNFAVDASSIATALRESGSAAQSAGISMDSLIGMVTSLSASTAKSGSRIGRALRTVFSRIMGDANASAESLGKVENALSSVGIALRQDEDTYRDLSDVLTDLAVKWDDLDEVMQANIARAIGGRRRYSDVIALIENWDMALEATTSSMNSLNSAMKENEVYMEGMEASWKQVGAQFNKIVNTTLNMGSKALSVGLAGGVLDALKSVNNFIKGLDDLGEELRMVWDVIKTLVPTIALLKTTAYLASTSIIGLAVDSQILLSSINPIIPGIIALTTAISKYITMQGKVNEALEEGSNSRKTMNKAINRTNELTKTELKNSKELINSYGSMVNKISDLRTEREKIGEEQKTSIPGSEIIKDILPFVEGAGNKIANKTEEIRLRMSELSQAFPEIYKAYEEQISKGDYTEFLSEIREEVEKYNTTLDNSISFIDKNTNAMLENVKQGQRELKLLKNQEERYDELNSIENRTLKQEQELLELRSDLSEDWYRLAGAGEEFGSVLDKIVNEEMGKFGKNGEEVNKVIKTMKEDIDSLSNAEQTLLNTQGKVGNEIISYKDKLKDLREEEDKNNIKIIEVTENLNKAKARYEVVGKQIDKTRQLQRKFRAEIKMLEEGIESLSETELSLVFESALSILTDLTDKMRDLKVQISDIRGQLEAGLDFQQFRAGLLGLSPEEEVNAYIGEYESAQDKILNIIEQTYSTEAEIDSNALRNKLRNAMDKATELDYEDLGFDVDDLFEKWDDKGFNSVKDKVRDLGSEVYNQLEKEKQQLNEDLEMAEAATNLINFNKNDLETMADEELQKVLDSFNTAINNREEFKNVLSGLEADFSLDENIDDVIIAEQNTRDFVETASNLYNELLNISELNLDNLNLEGTATDKAKTLSKALSDIPDSIKELSEVDPNKSVEDQLSSIENVQQVYTKIMNKINESDMSASLLSKLMPVITEIEDMNDKLEKTKNKLIDIQIEGKLIEFKEDLGLVSELEVRLSELNNSMDELNRLQDKATSQDLKDDLALIRAEYRMQAEAIDEAIKARESQISGDIQGITGFNIDSVSSIKEANKAIENLKSNRKDINKYIADLDLSMFQEENLRELLGVDKETFNKIMSELKGYIKDANLRDEQISQQLLTDEKELGLITEQDKEITNLNNRIKELNRLREEANDEDLIDRIIRVTNAYEDQVEVLEKLKNLDNSELESALEYVSNFDVENLSGTEEAYEAMEKLRKESEKIDRILNNMGFNQEQIEQVKGMYGIDEEALQETFDAIGKFILNTKQEWHIAMFSAFSSAVSSAVAQFEKGMSSVEKIEIVGKSVSSSLLDSMGEDKVKSKVSSFVSNISSSLGETISSKLGEGMGSFAVEGMKSLSEGQSLGKSLFTGAGAGIGAMFGMPKLGAKVGEFVGSIGEAVFGGSKNVDAMKEAKKVNEGIEKTSKNLEDFGITYDATIASYTDEAGGMRKLFGGENWDVDNLQTAKQDLEDMKEILKMVKERANEMGSEIKDSFGENLSYSDFRAEFDKTIGQAMKDTIIDSLWKSYAVQQYMNELSGLMQKVMMSEDRDAAIETFKVRAREIKGQISDIYLLYQDVMSDLDMGISGTPDVTMDRTFRAGSTSNITYNNSFSVQSQIFLGDEASAREAAKRLAPYIEDFLESRS